ncbi:DNA polymerase IV [Propionivibrio dicarboxylicus]|uniref:DNA polymerase IV n=1 Tax=Propionivibrio dicarboxylicus TaxID=83767 RepID=A0A1G7ZEP9_9RHOO|nr:DNA polymerase IV [Propionivibrio dicarboxylicus]SDH07253.1 DNA polymerase-4 [Propionivibrio dicarboxylicus]
MNTTRRIAHLDMDAFFASVELLSYPELRGRAVVVGGRGAVPACPTTGGERQFARLADYVGRGVVTTSTYEARAFGVFSGMGLMKSAQLAPEAVLLPANFEAYRNNSRRFKAAVAEIAPRIEDRGIDEIYIDLGDVDGESRALADRLRAAVFAATGLSCSIGIAPNKMLAKIASDLDKPGGVTVLSDDGWRERIWPLPARKINGVGPKSAERLTRLGIESIGQLAAAPEAFLVSHFGEASGRWMHQVANGIDPRPVVTESEPKSVSRESTFERDLHARHDREALTEIFTGLCVRVAEDLGRMGYGCRTVGIKLRYADFQSVTRDITLPFSVSDGPRIRRAAGECLKRVALDRRIRLLGVRASGLAPMTEGPDAGIGGQLCFPW